MQKIFTFYVQIIYSTATTDAELVIGRVFTALEYGINISSYYLKLGEFQN